MHGHMTYNVIPYPMHVKENTEGLEREYTEARGKREKEGDRNRAVLQKITAKLAANGRIQLLDPQSPVTSEASSS